MSTVPEMKKAWRTANITGGGSTTVSTARMSAYSVVSGRIRLRLVRRVQKNVNILIG